MDGGAWQATVHGVAESDMTEQHLTYSLTCYINLLSGLSAFGFPFLPSLLHSCFQTVLGCMLHTKYSSLLVLVDQLCLTLCNPTDYSPLGSSVHGILQARMLEWVVISFSRGSS